MIDGFWQTRPDEGKPASERTEVRIVFTEDTLFFGVVCYDRQPDGIIVTDSRRDSSLDDTDSFQLILDTYRDHQNGFVFGTNPAGIEYDAQVSNEGQSGERAQVGMRAQSGSGGGLNLNWDASWEVRTKTSPLGWSAEFAIPFRTLRYPQGRNQTWGVNFQRNIRRHKEVAFWAPLARQFSLYRLSEAGAVTSIEVSEQRNLKFIPYALGQVRRQGIRGSDVNWLGDLGGDAKYSITPGLTLDLTYNTDFAQVEVDEYQVNLDRFNLFYPEKRPFFLENAGIFSVGSSGQTEIFFSRRIGLADDGSEIPIIGGARVSGKIGRVNVGLLNMQTDGFEGVAPSNNFTVARVSRELPNRSAVGAIVTNRQGTGSLAADGDYNRAFAADGRLGLGMYGLVSGFVARTDTPGISSDEYAFKVNTAYDSPRWDLAAEYGEVADNFNPEMGFLARKGYRFSQFRILRRYRPADLMGILEFRPHVSYRGYWDFAGFQESGFLHIDNHTEWKNGYELHTGINFTEEGLKEPFKIYRGVEVPEGIYRHAEAQVVFNTNHAEWLSFTSRLQAGGFFGGNRLSWEPSVNLRRGDTFNSSLAWGINDIDLPGGDFQTNLIRMRLSYSFTPRIFVQSLAQYNDRANLWSLNLRFTWLQAANTGLFVVYNEIRDLHATDLGIPDRSLTIKFSRLFDIFQ
ncbi:MAG: carbohydrate binding family 9 domain-containing protein [Acidobacteria bacterium]|nr:carbohydrate binding family 9 domain-containing protein [Acidobacteriota bacterium]